MIHSPYPQASGSSAHSSISVWGDRKEAEYFYYFRVINETIRDFSLFTETSSAARTEAFTAIARRFRRVVAFDAQLLAFSRLASVTLLHRALLRSPFNLRARRPLTEPAAISANQIFVLDERFSLRLFCQFEAFATMIFRLEEAPLDAQQLVSDNGGEKILLPKCCATFCALKLPNVLDLGIGDSRRCDELAFHARQVAGHEFPFPF